MENSAVQPPATATSSPSRSVRRVLAQTIPWLITAGALYVAFRGVDFNILFSHLHEASLDWVLAALLLTVASYLLRSRRWQKLFPEHTLDYASAAQVLFLGFFMNNILPARAGEFVRAHMGARVSGQKRTLVLATVASERLVDGLTISLMFVAFAVGIGDAGLSRNMLLVAWLFAGVGIAVLIVLALRKPLLLWAHRLNSRIDSRASHYTMSRIEVFLHGLSPLTSPKLLPRIAVWSLLIWGVELLVYFSISKAFLAELSWAQCVLFLVAVNFSSLIPAAPGGIGVIEAVATAVLVSIGVEREHALTMSIAQHAIQYLVVGIPGAILMLNWKKMIDQVRAAAAEEASTEERQGTS